MDDSAVKRLALVLSVQAEIEAMKTMNLERTSQDMATAYDETHFWGKAEELRVIASKHEDQF